MGNDDIEVRFGAQTGDLESGASKATAAIKESVESMKGSFGGLSTAVAKVNGAFVALAAIVAVADYSHELSPLQDLVLVHYQGCAQPFRFAFGSFFHT